MNSKKYNNILNSIQRVVDTNKSLAFLASFILERYNFCDWNYVKSIYPTMKVTDYKFMLQNIEETATKSLSCV